MPYNVRFATGLPILAAFAMNSLIFDPQEGGARWTKRRRFRHGRFKR